MITIFRNIFELETPYYSKIETVLDRIKAGNSKDLVLEIRNFSHDKEERSKRKKNLPSILFSGKFPNRSANSLPLEHSGLIVLDIDDLKYDEISPIRAKLSNDKYILSLFLSPSGNGFKALVKIPPDIKRHKSYFLGLEKYFFDNLKIKLDPSGKNIGRVCYESYDPDLYINQDSALFTDLIEDIPSSTQKGSNIGVITATEDETINRVVKWWEKNYDFKAGRNYAIYQLAAALNRYGVSQLSTVSYCLKYVDLTPKDPFDAKEIETTVYKVYKQLAHMHGTEAFVNEAKTRSVVDLVMSSAIDDAVMQMSSMEEFEAFTPIEIENKAAEIKNSSNKKKSSSDRIFWYYNDAGKVQIDIEGLFQFISDNGYYVYYPNDTPDNYFFIKIDNNIIKPVDTRHIKHTVMDFVLEKRQNVVYNMLNDRQKYWTDKFLNALPSIKPTILRDSKETAFIPTPDGVYKITKLGIEKIDYIGLTEGYVWESQITKRKFNFIEGKAIESDFARFLQFVAGDDAKAQRLFSIIGYLVHTYKDPSNSKAVFFYDKNVSQFDGEAEGGSGKSLIIEGLKHIREVAMIPGDRVDFTRAFVFQEINESTQTAWVDELEKDADISKFFTRITNGLPIEKKRKDTIFISNHNAPKFVFTTNYKPRGSSGSHKRRRIDFGVSNYFNVNNTPMDVFKKSFFDGWDGHEWDLFFSVYLECTRIFLVEGVIKTEDLQDDYLTVMAETSQDFAEFWVKEENLNDVQDVGFFNGRDYYDKFVFQKNIDQTKFSIKKYYNYTKKILDLHNIKFSITGKGQETEIKFI